MHIRKATKAASGARPRTTRLGKMLIASLVAFFTVLIAVPQASAVPVQPGDTGAYTRVIHNWWTAKCVDLPNYGSVAWNTPVSQYDCDWTSNDNQIYNIVPTRTVGGTQLYEFINVKSNLCLDLPNYGSNPAGTPVSVYPCASNPASDNQEWSISSKSDKYGQYIGSTIVNWDSGLCLDVSGSANDNSDFADNLPLTIYYCVVAGQNSGWDDHTWSLDIPA